MAGTFHSTECGATLKADFYESVNSLEFMMDISLMNAIPPNTMQQSPDTEKLIQQLGDRAENLFITRRFFCTEAVLFALNKGLDGGLTENQVIAISAPFAAAMGESGCLCGALSGAVMATGVFLGKHNAERHRKEMREAARALHSAFKNVHGSTCCRVLTRKISRGSDAHFRRCAKITGEAAAMAARIILQKRPHMVHAVDGSFLSRPDSRITSFLRRCMAFLGI